MAARGQHASSIRRCTPVGTVHDDAAVLAAAIRKRLAGAARRQDAQLTVFAQDGAIYATRATSTITARVSPAQIVGLYTHLAAANDIADDILEWRALA